MSRALTALLLALALAAPLPAPAQLGLDLTAPEPAPRKKKDEPKKAAPKPAAKPAPRPAPADPLVRPEPPLPPPPVARPPRTRGVEPAAPPAAARAEVKPRLEAARALLDQGKAEAAALAYDAILRDPGLAEGHDEARYQLARALAALGLDHAALTTLDEVLARGPSRTRHFHDALERLFEVGDRLANEQPLLARVARHAREGVPPGREDRFHALLATYEFDRGRALEEAGKKEEARVAWGEARRLAALVREAAGDGSARAGAAGSVGGQDTYARAVFLDGLALYALGQEPEANERFKEVVRLTNPKRGRAEDPVVREQAFLQLARLHYQNRQNRYAIFYYGKMPWGGPSWLEGLWEASYAHYRIGEHEKALGNLLTLQSAYFKDEFFPESWVLKAIIYYENCRYPEATSVLKDFTAAYEPLYDELTALTARPGPPEAFLEQAASPRVRALAFTDRAIRRLAEAAREIDGELARGLTRRGEAFRGSLLGKAIEARLAQEKAQLLNEAGLRARGKLEYERDQLRAMLAQALRIEIEVSRQEREALESSLAAGSQVEVVKNLRWTHAVSDEHLYWPYQGEFWRDELGTYSYTLTKGCKDRPPRSAAP
ncbi:MAG: adventurous gliding motility protein GltC [Anaeromyxobacter sp.]|nr:adventurous gliding motility protein GltC [Anaeromyxobacter sp.]MBL0276269.1 adventurous gliding motility protein GltC [Anaeromyxobacter sp.]